MTVTMSGDAKTMEVDMRDTPNPRGGPCSTGGPPALSVLDELIDLRARLMQSLAPWLGKADAEDALQDAYLRALTKGASLRNHRSATAWFRRLARRAAIDHLRHTDAERRARTRWHSAPDTRAALPVDEGPSVCGCVADAVAQLRPGYVQVLRRVDLEDADIATVARELRITPNNVRVRLHRARRSLRAQLLVCCGICGERGFTDCSCRDAT